MSKKLQRKSFRQCVLANIRDTTIISQKPYTQVTIVVSDESGVNGSFFSPAREFHGFSKCNPGDAWDAELGYKIAHARAVRAAVEWMEYCISVDELVDELLDNVGAAMEAEIDSIINHTPSPSSKKTWRKLRDESPLVL